MAAFLEGAKAAYGWLHDLVKRRLHGNAKAEGILAEHDGEPRRRAV
jgi:hypothetical protein